MKIKEIKNIRGIKKLNELDATIDFSKNNIFYSSNGVFKTSFKKMLKSLWNEEFNELKDFIYEISGSLTIKLDGKEYVFRDNKDYQEMGKSLNQIKEKNNIIFFDKDVVERIEKCVSNKHGKLSEIIYDEKDESYKEYEKQNKFICNLMEISQMKLNNFSEKELENTFDFILSQDFICDKENRNQFKKGPLSNKNISEIIKNIKSTPFNSKEEYAENLKKIEDLKEVIKLKKDSIFNYEEILKITRIEKFNDYVNSIFKNRIILNNKVEIRISNKNLEINNDEKLITTLNKEIKSMRDENGKPLFENIEALLEMNKFFSNKAKIKSYENANKPENQPLFKKIYSFFEKITSEKTSDIIVEIINYIEDYSNKNNGNTIDFKNVKINFKKSIKNLKEIDNTSKLKYDLFFNYENISQKIEEYNYIFDQKLKKLSVFFGKGRGKKEIDNFNTLSSSEKNSLILDFLTYKIKVREKRGITNNILIIDDAGEKFDYKNKHGFIAMLSQLTCQNKNTKILYLSHLFDFSTSLYLALKSPKLFRRAEIKENKIIFKNIDKPFIENFIKYKKNSNDLSSLPLIRQISKSFPFKIEKIDDMFHYRKKAVRKTIKDLVGDSKIFIEIFTNDFLKFNYYEKLESKCKEIINSYDTPSYDKDIENQLKDKIILSLYSRIYSEKYFQSKFNKEDENLLFFKEYTKSMDLNEKDVFDLVIYSTNDFNHLNLIIMSPLLDTSIEKVIEIAKKVKKLNNKKT